MTALRRSLAFALLLPLFAACGGGGGGGGGGGPTVPPPALNFTAATVAPPSVHLVRGAGSTATVLELEVRADQLPPIYGMAFDLTFPANLLRFESFAEGNLLDRGGAQTTLQVAESPSGRLVVGYSRLGDTGMAGGSATIAVLRFTAIGAGTGSFAFSANQLFDATGSEIRGPAWGGGTVQVTL